MNIKNKLRVSVSLLVISSFILSGCESVSSKDMLVGAAAIGAAGALGYYAGHHKKGSDHDEKNINPQSLVGAREQQASDELAQHGFNLVDGWQKSYGNHASYEIWFNQNEKTCLKLVSVKGEINSASKVSNDDCNA